LPGEGLLGGRWGGGEGGGREREGGARRRVGRRPTRPPPTPGKAAPKAPAVREGGEKRPERGKPMGW